MPNAYFLDTNIAVYAATARTDEPRKFRIALALLDSDDACVSAQVLQEFYTVAIRKPAIPLSPSEAAGWVDRLAKYRCAEIDPLLVRAAIALSQRYRISYWDAAILTAAERLGAGIVYSEDLSHGQVYGAVRVENPFL
ncbi:MAG: PIN domain-containing protein [Caulobacteraceae bacterium]